MPRDDPYYRADLARIHHEGFGFHAERCAPGILALLEPVRRADGVVLEIGAGSGALTRHLVAAGHRVVATDASPAMIELCRGVEGVEGLRELTLPDDPVPPCAAVVGVGHALNYLPDRTAVERSLAALADALLPGGVFALDLCDLTWGEARTGAPDMATVTDDWALITRFSLPAPDHYVREMTTFVTNGDGSWRRDDERHDNVLLDSAPLPDLLARHGVEATARTAFGAETLPRGLITLIGTKRG